MQGEASTCAYFYCAGAGEIMWNIIRFDEIDSTNTRLKQMPDAPHGTVLVAKRQTAGRGRLGRSFSSPHGIYLSALLCRKEDPSELLHLTAMAAVAVRRAIVDACGIETQIKWVNDLILDNRKLCGILVEGCDGRYIIGIGINCNTDLADLPEEVQTLATRISCDEDRLIDALAFRLREMDEQLFSAQAKYMQEFGEHCITVGKTVQLVRGAERTEAFCLGVDENAALLVRLADGSTQSITSGEACVRGLYGYV